DDAAAIQGAVAAHRRLADGGVPAQRDAATEIAHIVTDDAARQIEGCRRHDAAALVTGDIVADRAIGQGGGNLRIESATGLADGVAADHGSCQRSRAAATGPEAATDSTGVVVENETVDG